MFCAGVEPLELDMSSLQYQVEVRGQIGFESQLAVRYGDMR